MTPVGYVTAAALALSAIGNFALGRAWLQARDAATLAIDQRDGAKAAASACSAATDELRVLADRRAADAKVAQAQARSAAAAREQLAMSILSTPAAIPGDDCGSARVRVDEWLKGRAER